MTATAHKDRDEHGHFKAPGHDACARCEATSRTPKLSLVKPGARPPLPRRTAPGVPDPGAITWAAQAALKAGVPARVLQWRPRPDGTVHQHIGDGILLTHTGTDRGPITATYTCTHGVTTTRRLTGPADWADITKNTEACATKHPGRPRDTEPTDLENAFSLARRVRTLHDTQATPATADKEHVR